jgi:hypothetical protein
MIVSAAGSEYGIVPTSTVRDCHPPPYFPHPWAAYALGRGLYAIHHLTVFQVLASIDPSIFKQQANPRSLIVP